MNTNQTWKNYYTDWKIARAKGLQFADIDYGRKIYSTPLANLKLSKSLPVTEKVEWLVYQFNNEYNVFFSRKYNLTHVATFAWKEQAMQCALEMYLACIGRLSRKGIIHSYA